MSEKNEKKKNHTPAKLTAAAALALLLFGGGGLGLGGGSGFGTQHNVHSTPPVSDSSTSTPDASASQDATPSVLLIQVTKDQYLVDDRVVTLSELETMIQTHQGDFALEDHYASAKAWDEIKELFTRYNLIAIEQ